MDKCTHKPFRCINIYHHKAYVPLWVHPLILNFSWTTPL